MYGRVGRETCQGRLTVVAEVSGEDDDDKKENLPGALLHLAFLSSLAVSRARGRAPPCSPRNENDGGDESLMRNGSGAPGGASSLVERSSSSESALA